MFFVLGPSSSLATDTTRAITTVSTITSQAEFSKEELDPQSHRHHPEALFRKLCVEGSAWTICSSGQSRSFSDVAVRQNSRIFHGIIFQGSRAKKKKVSPTFSYSLQNEGSRESFNFIFFFINLMQLWFP